MVSNILQVTMCHRDAEIACVELQRVNFDPKNPRFGRRNKHENVETSFNCPSYVNFDPQKRKFRFGKHETSIKTFGRERALVT